jgi:pimeloyl-ACP methyl ester carboxylesterase
VVEQWAPEEWIAAMRPALEMPLWAIRDGKPAQGRYPVVIYAPSFSSVSWENADLCEYLASHGYVVLASPSIGTATRQMTTDVAGINAQATDISFLAGHARTLSNADTSRIAVVGFSWGGISNVVAAGRDSRIGALIALDGSPRYWPGVLKLIEDVRVGRMTIPLLAFSKTEWTLEEQARYLTPHQLDGPNVTNAWVHGDFYGVNMLGMTHRQFSSMFQRNEQVWNDFHDPERRFAVTARRSRKTDRSGSP